MEMLTSAQNEWVSEARKLKQRKYREAKGLFLAEGIRLSEEAAKAAFVEEVYYHESLADTERGAALLKSLSAQAGRFFKVSAKVMNALAETETPQGVVCVCRRKQTAMKEFQPRNGLVAAVDGIQDPGNLGSILRTLWAAGGQGLFCLRGSTDPYGGKCVRASMGGIFHVPVFADIGWQAAAEWALRQGFRVVAASPGGGMDYRLMAWPEKTLLCIGSEAMGLASIPAEEVDGQVSIPLAEGAESLNAGVAAGILIFSNPSR
jgi:TrmH family RNA methyltransferase